MKRPLKRPHHRPMTRPGAIRHPPGPSPRGGTPGSNPSPHPGRGSEAARPRPTAFVASPEVLARATETIAAEVLQGVAERRRADRLLASTLRRRRDLAPADSRFVSLATLALLRWRGWIEPLRPARPMAEQLLLAVLLDAPIVPPPCRVWARATGRDPSGLFPLADAPNWKTLSEGFRRLVDGGHEISADPWRLFPTWFREVLPLPPGSEAPKLRYLELLRILQTRAPLWVRAQETDHSEQLWNELRTGGIKPWVHRRAPAAARLDPDVDLYHLPAFERGALEIQDLAAQAVGLVCDPDPGERWWDACAGAGGKALHLASLMHGKGVVVATDNAEWKLAETVRRARRGPFRNITTKIWSGKRVAGKPGSFDGVLVDAPCSAIGTWRRNPDARWSLDRAAITRLADLQAELLHEAAAGVRVGGTLAYSVCTLTPAETVQVVRGFLAAHPAFRLDPFPHPLLGAATDGMLLIWPQESDSDAMFLARMVRTS